MKTWSERANDARRGQWEDAPDSSKKKAWLNSFLREFVYLKKDRDDLVRENSKLRDRERSLEEYIHDLHAQIIDGKVIK